MHPDLPYEQAYFDRALALRDRQQADLARAPRLAANPRAALELRKRVSRLGLADPDEAIAFGRIESADARWYIGKGAIWDDDNDLVVVNWQAPIAAPFYTATPDDPEGLDARRLYRCSGNQIREIEDLMFREVAQAITEGRPPEPALGDALLDALGSARSGELGDIVATIQASQYQVISRPLAELLVVQGGPGTGKTVVGLHRVSWLLFNRRERLDARDVLVVGPNPAFVRYISAVLPSLGDEAVVQLPVQSLGPRVRVGRVDPPEVRRLKGDRRLLRLILRGVRNRQRVEATPVELSVEGRTVELDGRRIATRARQLAGRPHNEGYRMLRAFLVAEVGGALSGGPMPPTTPLHGEALRDIDNYLSRVWPSLTPQTFLVELLSSRRQLLAAGAGTLSEAELDLLALPSDAQVTTWQWSVDDIPILDAAAALLDGVAATYDHIVLDEAQDLSPLQLESIRRRSRAGSMTVLGDLAQATSPWAPSSWDPIVQALRHERVTTEVVELEYGYRLPAEVHEVAMRLLPEIAPGMACPQALRTAGHEIETVPAATPEDLPASVVGAVGALAADGIVGVIAPAARRTALASALDDAGVAWAGELRPGGEPVVLMAPDEAKGLEFDSVVVVEPAEIAEAVDHGMHALFVALTRCTNRLALVHARPLPTVLGLGPADDTTEDAPEEIAVHDRASAGGPAVPDDADDAEGADEPGVVAGPHRPSLPDTGAMAVPRPDDALAADGPAEDEATASTSWLPETVAMPVPFPDDDHEDAAAADRAAIGHVDLEGADVARPSAADDTEVGARGADVAADEADGAPPTTPRTEPEPTAVVSVTEADPGIVAPEPATPAPSPPVAAPAPPALADRVVVSTPAADAVDALGELDHDIAAAVAGAVVDRLSRAVSASLLPLVAEEIARALAARTGGQAGPAAERDDTGTARSTNGHGTG